MTDLEKLRLTLNPGETDERQYDIYPVQTSDADQSKDAFSIAPPGLAPASNILLGVSGMQSDITINATAWDDGTDRSNGTAPTSITRNGNTYTFDGTVVSVEDQIVYLEWVMHSPEFAATWELDHLTGSMFDDAEVFVENVSPTHISSSDRKWKPVTIRLRRGSSV